MQDKFLPEKTTRRTMLKQLAGAAMASQLSPGGSAQGAEADPEPTVILEDSDLRVTFDQASGALTGLMDKSHGWVIHRRPELGVSFRMQAPLPARHDNFILGRKQRAARVQKQGNQVHLEWRNLVSEHAGVLPITFRATVTLDKGILTFESSLINSSKLVINTVEYPYLGDLSAPTPETQMWRRHMTYANLESDEIHPHFRNEKGYWGDMSSLQTAGSRFSLFCLIQLADHGLYVQVNDPASTYLVQYTFEQKPGNLESIFNRVPEGATISGTPVHLEFGMTHFLFAAPNSTRRLTPVVLRGYSGDWQAGVDLYKEWRAAWYKQRPIPDWAKEVHSWQQIQVNSPEDSLRYSYRDLVKLGEDCARNGVKAIQLVGWNRGGQDRGNPCLDTDPRLGTWQELHEAIAQVQAKGVKIVLFGKFLWADISTGWYRDELYKYDMKDPYGIPYQAGGYSYDTAVQRAGINTRRFTDMCFLDPAYLRIAAKEFKKATALGPAGFLYDEVCHHGPGMYCFAPGHGHSVPGYVYAGDIPMGEELDGVTHHNPDFLMAGEGPQDIVLQAYPFSYFRISDQHTPICRYIDPQVPLMIAVTGFDDREMLNRILMYRYIISYEPHNFKGRLGDFPLTLEYGKKIDRLRRRYKRWLWDAEYRDKLGAKVTADGTPHRLYSVFRTQEGERAVVVVNQDPAKSITATVELPNPRRLRVVTPEQPDGKPATGTLRIPPRSAAVILEQANV
ncbi:MAG TPA: DUF6259 domain-containing protein [Terriglobia bacterium]|nr:DUF6259 domain-containing protein [Terriglobia bacterium]